MSELLTIEEFEATTGISPSVLAARAPGRIELDWAGRPSIQRELAAEICGAVESERDARIAKQNAYAAYLSRRQEEKALYVRETTAAAIPRLHRKQVARISAGYASVTSSGPLSLGPDAREELQIIARQAEAEFDEKHPAKPWEKFKG